jgi:3-oxoacyl-[acyl-carrier-protein] synthase-3
MSTDHENLTAHLWSRLRQVQQELGQDRAGDTDTPFAELLDSMGLVEYVLVLADDFGVSSIDIERCVAGRFETVADLAAALAIRSLRPGEATAAAPTPRAERPTSTETGHCWLAGTAVRLPDRVQTAGEINHLLQRPPGWLESHAGISQRRIWEEQDPLAAATEAGRECMDRCGLHAEKVDLLLVASEAPPLLLGLAAALHHRLQLRPTTVALDVGGACTGFLTALWLARSLLAAHERVLVITLEAPSLFLSVAPGEAGEAAALFGDGAAACILTRYHAGDDAVVVRDVMLKVDGSQRHLLQIHRHHVAGIELQMQGKALATRATRTMAQTVRETAGNAGIALADLHGVVIHGGNGRFPVLLARQLGLPPQRIWSQAALTGNLGSASLPVAWAARPHGCGPVIWTAIGAGLTWGAALTLS